jgi:uncharacterized protein (TIGR00730 family)
MEKIRNIVFFGDGNCPEGSNLYQKAELAGYLVASRGINVVTGGYAGIMDACLKGAIPFGVERIAVVARTYRKIISTYATKIIEVENYLERLDKLISIGDAFIIFEGGTGTLLELTTLWALGDRGFVSKPVFCIDSYWERIINCLENTSIKFNSAHSIFTFLDNVEELKKLPF